MKRVRTYNHSEMEGGTGHMMNERMKDHLYLLGKGIHGAICCGDNAPSAIVVNEVPTLGPAFLE